MSQARPYRGVEAPDRQAQRRRRLLDAGLDLLAGRDSAGEPTVRGICAQAGVSARYFYESFSDKDHLVSAVFDWVIADIAATTQAAVRTASESERNRAGIANLVRVIAGDARIGRLLFDPQLSHAVLARKRVEASGVFAVLSGDHVADAYRVARSARTASLAHFVVGGVGQTIGAWVAGDIDLDEDGLVDEVTRMVERLGEPGELGRVVSIQPTG